MKRSLAKVHRSLVLGSYGVVYKAIHKASKSKRAIKLINKENVKVENEGELFSEIKVLKELDHPSIMRIYEFGSDKDFYYLVSEYIDGGELFDEIVKRKYMCEEDAAYIIKQILSAIVYCHSRGVVHRDLKPENILIDSVTAEGKINIKVIDFGTALFVSPDTKMSEMLGTPYYIAPEVINGKYNEKCDVWSIGVILFILLSGTPPFNGFTDTEIMDNVKKGNYNFKSTLRSNGSSNMEGHLGRRQRPREENAHLQPRLANQRHRCVCTQVAGGEEFQQAKP